MSHRVAIVVVSHSRDVARSVADLVERTVSGQVRVAWSGGTADGGLGTDTASILQAIRSVYSSAGVAVLVDLGGAETNAEMAVERLPEAEQLHVQVCDGPLVEGAVMGAARAAAGAPLAEVCRSATEASA